MTRPTQMRRRQKAPLGLTAEAADSPSGSGKVDGDSMMPGLTDTFVSLAVKMVRVMVGLIAGRIALAAAALVLFLVRPRESLQRSALMRVLGLALWVALPGSWKTRVRCGRPKGVDAMIALGPRGSCGE